MNKICTLCKIPKSTTEFSVSNPEKGYLSSRCKSCKSKISKKYYKKHTKRAIVENVKRVLSNRQATRAKIVEYLQAHPCVDCGETDILVLDFDHVRGEKRFCVADMMRMGYIWSKKLLEEIAKCEIRCRNCHQRKTAKQQNNYRYQAVAGNVSLLPS